MGKIFFFRHGTTDENLRRTFCGITDTELKKMDKVLFPVTDVIFSSPLRRCTAYLNDPGLSGKKVIISDKLKETDFGLWEGLTFDEVMTRFPDDACKYLENPFGFEFPSGESFKKVSTRIEDFILIDLDCHVKSGKDILVISHEGIIKMILIRLFRLQDDFFFKFKIQNAKFTMLEYFGDFFMLQSLNSD